MCDLDLKATIKELKLKPGQTLVLECPQRITQEGAARIRAEMKERGVIPEGADVIVLDGGLTIAGIVESAAARAEGVEA